MSNFHKIFIHQKAELNKPIQIYFTFVFILKLNHNFFLFFIQTKPRAFG